MSLKKIAIVVVLLSFWNSVYADWSLDRINPFLGIPHPVYNAINKQLHRHNVHIKQHGDGDGPYFILLSNGKFFDWFSRYNPPQYSFSDSMKKDMDQYTVTHILENGFAIVALAHKPGHPTETEVFAGGDKSCGGEIKKAMQTKMNHYTVTQIFHSGEYPYANWPCKFDAFVALAHKPSYPNQTKVFVWGNKEDGGKIDKAMQSDMDHYTVTQIVSTEHAFVALGHKADYPNQTKVFAWGDKHDGGKIKKAIQSQMDQYTVTKIDLAGTCFLAFSHKPSHPNQTKVFSWGGDGSPVDCDKMITKAMKGDSNQYLITKISHITSDDNVTAFVALAHKSDNPNKTKVLTWGNRCTSCPGVKTMSTLINQYTVTQIVNNDKVFVALAHKPGHPDKTKVFDWGVGGDGMTFDKAMQSDMGKYTVTQVVCADNDCAALAHKPGHPDKTKVFDWDGVRNGVRIGKAMQSNMDKYIVTQVVCADQGCAALAHEPGYPNKTKVFAWDSGGYCKPYGGVYCVRRIDKSLQKKMDGYTVTKIIGYTSPPDLLEGGAFFAIAHKPGHPKETKVFRWSFL